MAASVSSKNIINKELVILINNQSKEVLQNKGFSWIPYYDHSLGNSKIFCNFEHCYKGHYTHDAIIKHMVSYHTRLSVKYDQNAYKCPYKYCSLCVPL